MNTLDSTARWMLGLYRFLLRLYPRAFREVFGDELCGVVALSLQEAGGHGRRALWFYFLREVLEMAPNILREYVSSQSFNRFIEGMLTHRQHSRWRQAGALGFALGFALMELVNRLGRFFTDNRDVAFPSNAVHVSVLNQPDGSLEITAFHWVGLLMLFACGLIAGSVLNRAEKPANRLWLPIGAAVSLAAAYALVYGLNFLVWAAQNALPYGYVLLNILNPWLFGGLAALGLGFAQRLALRQTRGPQFKLALTGWGGIFLGGLAGWVVAIAASLVDWIERSLEALIKGQAALPNTGLISSFFLYPVIVAVLFSAVEGWVYGGLVGEEMGKGRGALGAVPAAKPVSDGLAKVIIAVLVVIVMLSLLMLAVNTSRQG